MENRKRNVHLHVMVTPDELAAIHERMAEAGISNAGAYVRKMALNGYILHIDLAPVKELISLQRRCSNNLNQVAVHAHTHGVYPEEIDGLKRDYEKLWGEVSKVLRELSELRLAIDTALAERPADLDEFLNLMKRAGYEVKTVRGGGISFRLTGQGQERFTRLRASTLGDGYDLQDVLSAIEGKEKRPGRSERKISLAVDIQAKLAAGKGPGYERWAKVFNIKQMAAALAYIQDNNLTDYEQLAQKATEAADRFHVISEQVKQTEQAMKTNAGLKAATVQYAKTRPVFEQYKATKYSRKFLAEHEADLELYRAAQAEMRSLLGGAKLPKMDVLKEEGRKLTAKKKQLYGEYQKARRDMQEIVTIKANIDTLMGYTEPGRKQEKER